MANSLYVPLRSLPYPGGPYSEALTGAVYHSSGPADYGKVPLLGPNGKLDPSFGGGGGGALTVTMSNDVGTVEMLTVVPRVNLSWVPSLVEDLTQTLAGPDIPGGSVVVPSGIQAYAVNFTFDPPSPASYTWTITVFDGTTTAMATTTVAFVPRRFWGVNPGNGLANADILALPTTPSGGSDLVTSLVLAVTYDCSGGPTYPYFCYPASYGVPANVLVSGLGFTAFATVAQSFTSALGYVSSYSVLRFNSQQNGAAIHTVWQ